MSSKDYEKTIKMLKKLPMYKQLKTENKELIERIRSLEYAVQYLESKNAKLEKKLNKKPILKPVKIEPSYIIDLTGDDEEEIKNNALDELLAKYPSYQNHKNNAASNDEVLEEEVSDNEEVSIEIEEVIVSKVEVVVEEEEEVVVEDEEEEEEEEVVEEEVVEEEVVEEEEEEEEEVVVVEEEEEAEEEVVVSEEEEEEEVVVSEEVVEEEEDVYEIQINGKTYYVMNEIDSTIYEADEDGEITIDAGIYKNGTPTFH